METILILGAVGAVYYIGFFILIFRFFNHRVTEYNLQKKNAWKTRVAPATTPTTGKEGVGIKKKLTVFDKTPEIEVNAFRNDTWYFPRETQLRYCFLGPILIPIRLTIAISAIVVAIVFSNMATYGLDVKKIMAGTLPPLKGMRLLLRVPVTLAARTLLFALGVVWVKVKGKRAASKEAPLQISNHRTFIDPLYLVSQSGACPVSASSNLSTPGFGTILKMFQPINVDRDLKDNTIVANMIKERATSNGLWPQTVLFPEGTTTNGQALIYFKLGAFTPGVPVQPVIVSYPNKTTDISWVDAGPSLGETLLKLCCNTWLNMTVEYLPTYIPSEEEKKDTRLFARNVRNIMAEKMGVPTTEESFDDCILMMKAATLHLPAAEAMINLRDVRKVMDIDLAQAKDLLEKFAQGEHDSDGHIYEDGFVKMFPDCKDDKGVRKLFNMLDKDGHGYIDFREYVLGVSLLNGKDKDGMDGSLRMAFRCFDKEGDGYLDIINLSKILKMGFPNATNANLQIMFDEADADKDGLVDIEDFLHFCHNHESVLPKFRDKIFGKYSLHAVQDAEKKAK